MPLILTLSQIPDLGGEPQTRIVNDGSLTIGRGPGNDWVLADPQRHLSRTHCVIAAVDGGYVLTDLSANGVFLNGSPEPLSAEPLSADPLAADRHSMLAGGDEIRLGDYVITVAETAAAPAAMQPADTLSDLFATGADFAHPVAAASAPRLDDPLDRADDMASRQHAAVEDLFKGFEPLEAWKGPSQPDNADAPVHAMAEPRFEALPRFDSLDIDALLGDEPPGHGPLGHGPLGHGPLGHGPLGHGPLGHGPLGNVPEGHIPLGHGPLGHGPLGHGPLGHGPLGNVPEGHIPLDHVPLAQAAPAAAPAPTVPPVCVTPASPAPAATGDAEALLAAFLDGAGVTGLRLDAGTDPRAALHSAGAVFRVMVEGLREVLMSRAAVKQEFRAAQTMLGPCDNNPLKFSISAEDAVAALLRLGRRGYQPPLDATREAFADLKSHELAVMAGVQTALTGLLRRIDPTVLEGQQHAGLLPVARKARCWEAYRTTYKDIARAAEDDFQSAFGRDFARAYEAQARQL